MSDSLTLYKLIILYLLKKVNFPLTNGQISAFIVEEEYTSYFNVQQALSELVEAGLLREQKVRYATQYFITEDGEQTLEYFGKKIGSAIMADIDQYIEDNKMELRNEAAIVADYYKNAGGEYCVDLEVKEGKGDLIDVTISVPDKEQAIAICDHWEKKCQEVYQYLMNTLL